MVLTDLKYIDLVGGAVYKIFHAAEILALIILYEIVAAAVSQHGQMLVLGSNHSGGHLIYGTVTAACNKTGLLLRVCLAVFAYMVNGRFLGGCKINFKINLFRKLLYIGTDDICVACFTGFVVDDKTIMHSPEKVS